MKFWTKVVIIGAVTFVGLSVLGFFIANGVAESSNMINDDDANGSLTDE